MSSLKLGGLTLAMTFAAGFGFAWADDQNGNGTANPPPANPAPPPAPAVTGTGGGSAPGGTSVPNGTNGGTPGNGPAPGVNVDPTNKTNDVPPATRLSPAVENAILGSRFGRVGSVVKGVWSDATDPMQSSTFIGGIALNDLAQAGVQGIEGNPTASDDFRDVGHALTTPEFYAGVGVFNAVYPRTEALAGKMLGLNFIESAGATEGAGLAERAAGTAAGAAKRNIALGLTMTALQLFKFDFGGFNLLSAGKDIGHGLLDTVESPFKTAGSLLKDTLHPSKWGSDIANGFGSFVHGWSPFGNEAAKLKHFTFHFGSIPLVKEKWCPFPLPEDLAITLASFAAAGPIWAAVKTGLGMFAKRFLVAEAAEHTVMTPIEVGEVVVQPEGPGEVADGVEEAGEGIGAFAYAAIMGAIDLGGLLFTANAIQTPVQNWNDKRIFQDAAATAEQNYIAVTKENGGNPDPKKLQDAMSQLATAMADLRDFHYLPVAIEDAKFVNRLQIDGVTPSAINAVGTNVMQQDGAWLAAPGQTAQLESAFGPDAHPGVTNEGDYTGLVERHDAEVKDLLGSIENPAKEFKLPNGSTTTISGSITNETSDPSNPNAQIFTVQTPQGTTQQVTATDYKPVSGGVWESQLDPASKSFAWSDNRQQLYDEEIAILARGGNNLTNNALQSKVLQDMQIVGGLASAETQLLGPPMKNTFGIAQALPAGTGH